MPAVRHRVADGRRFPPFSLPAFALRNRLAMSMSFDEKGYKPDPDYENVGGVVSSLPRRRGYDSAQDVFGNEDGAQVGQPRTCWSVVKIQLLIQEPRYDTGP